MSFIRQEEIRCLDCDIRGDLHDTGYPLKESRGRIRECAPCAGTGHHVVLRLDPYATGIDVIDPYVKRRAERAALGRIDHVPRSLRRRLLDRARVEALMSPPVTVRSRDKRYWGGLDYDLDY